MTYKAHVYYPLVEAYKGTHEVDHEAAVQLINNDTPRKHLETYLEWEGIFGYTENIIQILLGDKA